MASVVRRKRSYAEDTSVPVERTRAEIEKLVRTQGDQFMSGWEAGRAVVQFRRTGRMYRMTLPLPKDTTSRTYAQTERSRWRALLLSIKAKFTAVEAGIIVFEQEFLAHVILPDGRTVGEHAANSIDNAYKHGKAFPIIPPQLSLPEAPIR